MSEGKQPRFPGTYWVGHGEIMSKIGTFIWQKDDAGLSAYVLANKEELGNLTGAFINELKAAGYNVANDGTVTGPGYPPGTGGNPAPDPKVPTMPPVPFVPDHTNTDTRKVMSAMPQGVVHSIAGSGKKKLSWTIGSGGYPCYLSFDPTFQDPNQTTGATGGTPWLPSPDGNWTAYLFYTADPGRLQPATVDIYTA